MSASVRTKFLRSPWVPLALLRFSTFLMLGWGIGVGWNVLAYLCWGKTIALSGGWLWYVDNVVILASGVFSRFATLKLVKKLGMRENFWGWVSYKDCACSACVAVAMRDAPKEGV